MRKLIQILMILAFILSSPSIASSQCFGLPKTTSEINACNKLIALEYAPIIKQKIDESSGGLDLRGKSDLLTRIDFDGNWLTKDNWENLQILQSNSDIFKPYVYYSVSWSSTHWFILYGFYHARDYSNTPFCGSDNHENDMEGIMVIVKRPKSAGESGMIEAITTVYHDHFSTGINTESQFIHSSDYYERPTSHREDIGHILKERFVPHYDGEYILGQPTVPREVFRKQLALSNDNRPIVIIEDGTHAVYPYNQNNPDGKINPCEGSFEFMVECFPGTAPAESPVTFNGTEHIWKEKVDYELVDVFEKNGLWDRRKDFSLFPTFGVFSGDNYKDNAAKSIWWHDDVNDGNVSQGDQAFFPGKLIEKYFDTPATFDGSNEINFYNCNDIEIDISGHGIFNYIDDIRKFTAFPEEAEFTWTLGDYLVCLEGCLEGSREIKVELAPNAPDGITTISLTIKTKDGCFLELTEDVIIDTDKPALVHRFKNPINTACLSVNQSIVIPFDFQGYWYSGSGPGMLGTLTLKHQNGTSLQLNSNGSYTDFIVGSSSSIYREGTGHISFLVPSGIPAGGYSWELETKYTGAATNSATSYITTMYENEVRGCLNQSNWGQSFPIGPCNIESDREICLLACNFPSINWTIESIYEVHTLITLDLAGQEQSFEYYWNGVQGDNTLSINCDLYGVIELLIIDPATGCMITLTVEGYPDHVTCKDDETISQGENRLGKDQLDTHKLKVFPNPTTDAINFIIHGLKTDEYAKLYLMDNKGKIVKFNDNILLKKDSETAINISTINKGLYILKVETTTSIFHTKVIVM